MGPKKGENRATKGPENVEKSARERTFEQQDMRTFGFPLLIPCILGIPGYMDLLEHRDRKMFDVEWLDLKTLG